jgi:hypothetical protein
LISPQGYQLGEYFDVACTSDNELLVGWYSPFAPPYPGFNVLQRFDLNGAPLSSPVPVDSGKWGVSGISAILPRPDGGALLLWEIYSPPSELTTVLRVFNGDLLPDSEETLLALHENTCWLMDAYSVLPDELAIAYDCYFPESYPRQARFASFDLSSGELVAEHLVEHDAGAGTMRPRAARLPGGAGIGAWNLVSNNAPGAIQLTTFDRRIVPLQPTAPVPTDPAFGASEVDIAALAGGNAGWVLWNSYGEDGSIDGVFAQRFDIVAPSIVEIPASSGVSLSGLAVILAASAVLALRRRRNNPG